MPVRALTGTRIRERRTMLGIRQSALARTAGISAAYLNLIEHNRRRIGGKLLNAIAEALGVDAATLSEGAGAALVADLREAAARPGQAEDARAVPVEDDRTEDFAGRFPGWAGLVAAQARRIEALERTVAVLGDRLAHDPHLAATLHELLTTVASINSTAAILVDTRRIEAEWRDRFHRNIHEDSQRLAERSRALVAYLDAASEAEPAAGTPREELDMWLNARGHHLPELEGKGRAAADRQRFDGLSPAAQALVRAWAARYAADAERMPLDDFARAALDAAYDPGRLAQAFGTDPAAAMRRIAVLPGLRAGLVACDGSGALTYRRALDGFAMPRFGAACPLWPLYQALSRPAAPVRAVVEMSGRDHARFLCYAIALPTGFGAFDGPPMHEATMLILPPDTVPVPEEAGLAVGASCRICPRANCPARRDPSVLSETSAA